MDSFLRETAYINFNNPEFDKFLVGISDKNKRQVDLAIELYNLVRDSFLYDPYHLNISSEGLIASRVLIKKRAWCVEKSTVLAACARRFGIPSRLGYAIVKNHIGVERLVQYLKREEIVFHGYVELYLDGKWVKCTPAFDPRVCRMSGVSVLTWNGRDDSMFQEFEKDVKFMEYIHFYGEFDDVPIQLMNTEMKKYYPHLFEQKFAAKEFSFVHQ